MHRFANPGRFLRMADRLQPWLITTTILAFLAGLYLALWQSPADYQQGETVRIMYIHVPAAWLAMFAYCLIAVASASALIWRHPLAHVAAEAASPVGAGFTLIALVSGSLWGRPMWGVYWVWDARLTSFLLLFFLYLGHMALIQAFDDRQRGQRTAAILALVGAINLPVIKFSVDWWNTLHQPASILRSGGPSIDSSMLSPLFSMAIAFQLFFFVVLLARMKAVLLEARSQSLLFNRLRMQAASTGGKRAN
ncbi:heme ABC transporter permease [Dongia soli]|uniref:Heme exporter protein C n=1 Tax=Dongia soli TaxID=600628 RepID=A0ABU5EHW3_9PROT|nr:heme ABC transporter permease [Dongia soli]MDY0885902.1 heme ABC transporter permease [Dongia soli]